MKKTIKQFKVEYVQVLDEKGKVDSKLDPKLSVSELKALYKKMHLIRQYDRKGLALQRTGKTGTYVQYTGQEAGEVALTHCLKKGDWFFPGYRETGALIALGVPISKLLLYWAGDERGMNLHSDVRVFPIAIPVGSQTPHCTGAGWALKLQGKKNAAIVTFGDGATSRGDFHSGLNFAGVYSTNSVFFCQNNQFAISTARARQTMAETIAQKGIAYGVDSVQVDGNDILGLVSVIGSALKKARAGKGPTLIEAFTYRMCDHTTSDDAKKYRDPKDLKVWAVRDPLLRFQKYLKGRKLWSESWEKKLESEHAVLIDQEVKKWEEIGKPPIDQIFAHVFAESIPQFDEQLEDAKRFLK